MEYQAEIGYKNVALATNFYRDIPDILEKAGQLEKAAWLCAGYGMAFHYHHHYHECQHFNGKTVLDHLMDSTDPKLVLLELDTFWALRGGEDSLSLIDRYAGRIRLIHQKDFVKNCPHPANLFGYRFREDAPLTMADYIVGELDAYAELGQGCMDLAKIVGRASGAGAEYLILDQDYSRIGEFPSIRVSMEALRRCRGLEWQPA